MNGDCPSPPKRVVQEQAGVFEPSSVEKFDESIGPTSARHGRHSVIITRNLSSESFIS
jgi:hypothetical protein